MTSSAVELRDQYSGLDVLQIPVGHLTSTIDALLRFLRAYKRSRSGNSIKNVLRKRAGGSDSGGEVEISQIWLKSLACASKSLEPEPELEKATA